MDKVYCICDVGFRHCDEQLEIPISKLFRYERERYESLRPLPETRKLLRGNNYFVNLGYSAKAYTNEIVVKFFSRFNLFTRIFIKRKN